MLRLFLILIFFSLTTILTGQLSADFSSADLSDWNGDISLFKVNDVQQLQLNDTDGGEASIYTSLNFADSISWSVDVDLRFNPSGSNALEIWLCVDDFTSLNPTGYKLQIGETGSDDALNLFWVEAGEETIMASGDMGQVATAFALQIIITKDGEDNWTLFTKGAADPSAVESFSLNFQDSFLPRSGDFGLKCKYSSTRATLFYFDNIIIEELLPDTEGPNLTAVTVVSPTKLNLIFDEPLIPPGIANATYNLSTGTTISSAMLANTNTVCLELSEALPSGTEIEITVADVEDLNGNRMQTSTLNFILTESPAIGDLKINEVLYDPNSGLDADFVELINASDKFLKLDDIFLARANSSAVDVALPSNILLSPGDIIAFTRDTAEIIDEYEPIPEAKLVQLGITNYVNDAGNVWLKLETNNGIVTLDSLEYTNDFHSSLLTTDGKEGVSLERITVAGETNDPDNWYSASALNNFATPGYANSQAFTGNTGDEQIELEYKVFTPNGDGFEDLAKLNFEFDKPGYVGNIGIYDDHGRLQTMVSQNKILGTSGSIVWEGDLPDGNKAPVGMYIIVYDFFHADGEVIAGKKVCVLSSPLN